MPGAGLEVREDRLTFPHQRPHSRGDLGGGRRSSGVKTGSSGVREDEVMVMVSMVMGRLATILVSLAAVAATPGTGAGSK